MSLFSWFGSVNKNDENQKKKSQFEYHCQIVLLLFYRTKVATYSMEHFSCHTITQRDAAEGNSNFAALHSSFDDILLCIDDPNDEGGFTLASTLLEGLKVIRSLIDEIDTCLKSKNHDNRSLADHEDKLIKIRELCDDSRELIRLRLEYNSNRFT